MKLKSLLKKIWNPGNLLEENKGIYIDYSKVFNTIESCTSIHHCLAANKLLTLFQNKYNDRKLVSSILIEDLIKLQIEKTEEFI